MTQLGKYELKEKLGSGRFGDVYKALDATLDREVALKVLKPEWTNDVLFVQQFQREAKTAAKIEHPNVVGVYEVGEQDGRYFIAMQYMSGGSLHDWMETLQERSETLSVDQALGLGMEIAQGLAVLHNRGLVHCDLKPSNILFDGAGHARIGDLGLALSFTSSRSSLTGGAPQHSPGTPAYMSPEQESGAPHLRPPADVYALGLVLVELLIGRSYKNLRPGTKISALRHDAPPWLDELLLKMLVKDWEQRLWDGEEATQALRECLAVSDVEARAREEKEAGWQRTVEVRHQVEGRAKAGADAEDDDNAWLESIAARWRARQESQARLDSRASAERKDPVGMFEVDCEPFATEPSDLNDSQSIDWIKVVTAQPLPEIPSDPQETPLPDWLQEFSSAPSPAPKPVEKNPGSPPISPASPKAPMVGADGNRKVLKLAQGVEMEFVRVPDGEFMMGTREDELNHLLAKHPDWDRNAFLPEQPQHTVYLDEYWIGKYPVTNQQYAAFVKNMFRRLDLLRVLLTPTRMADHPVNNLSRVDMRSFCAWLTQSSGKVIRLPTEAEWEKAARGTDGRAYPWGNQPPGATLCNCNNQVNNTTSVKSYSPIGDSPYGCANMSGNVWEWTQDWYAADYYAFSPARNPTGPDSGQFYILRGGSWNDSDARIRASFRQSVQPDFTEFNVGFRCAFSA
jgi:eukaryotic-like serine/threonine-protein kinase